MRHIKLWRKLSAQSRLSTDPWYIRNAMAIFLILDEILPLFAKPWETPARVIVLFLKSEELKIGRWLL